MTKRTLVRGVIALVAVAVLSASVYAGFSLVRFRNYELKDDGTVRTWVENCGCFGRFAQVSLGYFDTKGQEQLLQGYVYVPPKLDLFVDFVPKDFDHVSRVIVTGLGTVGQAKKGCRY